MAELLLSLNLLVKLIFVCLYECIIRSLVTLLSLKSYNKVIRTLSRSICNESAWFN